VYFSALEASFRGVPLSGQVVAIPERYKGYVLHEANEKLSEMTERNLYVSETFHKFTYWNYDKKTTKEDGIHRFLYWSSLSKAVSWYTLPKMHMHPYIWIGCIAVK